HLPFLGIERHQRRVGLMQENLTVGICEAAIDRVATHDGNDVWILLGLVFPKDLRVILQIERKNRIRERPMDVHDVADHERTACMATQNTSRKRPCHLQLADIVGRDLVEPRVALVGIISCRHHPIFWVLRHSDQLIVGLSSPRSEDRYDAHASAEQEIAHRYPPCDMAAGNRRKAHAVPRVGTRSMGRASGSVSQRNEAQGTSVWYLYAPPSLRGYVRIPVVLTSLKPEAARKIYSRP